MEFKKFLPSYNDKNQEAVLFEFRFTVFTPVYNCVNTIERVYESLLNQTYKNFEWLIINDGSTDDSHNVISTIVKESSLHITYINNKNNQHKMACFMQAIQLANGEFFLTFDADDECMPNALQTFEDEYNSIPEHVKPTIAALTGLCINQHNVKIGDDFPTDPFYSDPFELEAVVKVKGEKWGFTKTSILRNLSYPDEFITNGFMPESLIWNLIGKNGQKTKFFNKVLRIYYVDAENSISSSGVEKTALGSTVNYLANFNWFFKDYFFKTPIFFLKNLYLLLRLSKYSDFNLKSYTTSIDSYIIKILFIILWPVRKFLK